MQKVQTELMPYGGIFGRLPGNRIGNIDEFINSVPNDKWSEALLSFSDAVTPYHANAKVISKEKSLKASQNLPFLPHLKNMAKQRLSGKSEEESASDFLRAKYGYLEEYDVSFSVAEFDSEAEKAKIEEALRPFQQSGMTGRVNRVNGDYKRFSNLRQLFHDKEIAMERVIPVSCLPELLMAAPVLFFKSSGYWTDSFFYSRGSVESSWLYQTYNYRGARGFNSFDSDDVITPEISETIEKAGKVFNSLVIATPYHSMAPWDKDANFNIDPFLVGFNTDDSNMYVLRRWSGTGVFPRICDMIADTVDHLTSNLEKIGKINTNRWERKLEEGDPDLIQYVNNLAYAYERNRLSDFFQGKLTGLPIPAHMSKKVQAKSFLKRLPHLLKNI